MSWDKATDAETPQDGLTYNLRVGTTPGAADVLSGMADTTGGYRRIPAMGNANHNNSINLNLPDGDYYWSVQAVDTAFAGGAWSGEGSFHIDEVTLCSNGVFCLKSDTADGSTVFDDGSPAAHTITANGDAHHGDSDKFNGSTAICFDGSRDYLSMANSADWNFGQGDFSIDLWVNLSSTPSCSAGVGQWGLSPIPSNTAGIVSTINPGSTKGFALGVYQGTFQWYCYAMAMIRASLPKRANGITWPPYAMEIPSKFM